MKKISIFTILALFGLNTVAIDTVRIAEKNDILPELLPYSDIIYKNKEVLTAAEGTKSVIFNSDGSKLYAMNLEGMSIYEFDQPTRKIIREFKFKATPGTGWDYDAGKPISSYEEKPVEAAMSHNDRFLWVSLHNAAGIIPLRVDTLALNSKPADSKQAVKQIFVKYPDKSKQDTTIFVPIIKTGKTPKVIAVTKDNCHLLVSNWHSYNVSVLELDENAFPYGKIISTVPVSSIPRGIAIDENTQKSYVSIMGGASLAVIDNKTWENSGTIKVASNPRHLVIDSIGRLFISYNKLAKIACIEPSTGKTLFSADTHSQPRTIVLSKNHTFVFVTCYSSNMVDVFKITDTAFEKVISLPCAAKPVGVDIFETDEKLEAWVCSYSGIISVYNFDKK